MTEAEELMPSRSRRLLLIAPEASPAARADQPPWPTGSTHWHCERLDPTAPPEALRTALGDASAVAVWPAESPGAVVGRIRDETDLPILCVCEDPRRALEALQAGATACLASGQPWLEIIPAAAEALVRNLPASPASPHEPDVATLREECRRKDEQIQQLARNLDAASSTDPLTGLANRRAFAGQLQRAFAEAARYNFELTCIFGDLDDYHDLNAKCGSHIGDRILAAVGKTVQEALRSHDLAARYGSDEFVLLLPHTSLDKAIHVAERIGRELTSRIRTHGPQVDRAITLSMGISSLCKDRPTSADALLTKADAALAVAKERGRGRIVTSQEIAALSEPIL
jgi:diguanylate cyclase (GGDEF)-like protein